jgi:hypothetical protein
MARPLAIALLACLVLPGCRAPGPSAPPAEIQGAWETEHPKYADRSFEIRKDRLVLGTGRGQAATYHIRAVTLESDNVGPLTTITYADAEGVENVFAFYYYPTGGGVIRLKNQWDIPWNRKASAQ